MDSLMSYCMNPNCRETNEWQAEYCRDCGELITLSGREDHYRAFGYIGVGKFAVAYVGMQFPFGDGVDPYEDGGVVVIKSVAPGASFLAELEAKALHEVRGSYWFPDFYDTFVHSGRRHIVQEYIVGQPLDRLLTEGKKFSEKKTLKILTGVFSALKELHSIGILHRDIQPCNIMAPRPSSKRQDPIVIDLGLAFFRHAVSREPSRVLGCKLYSPPEQSNDRPNCRSDIFAAGITGAELLGADPELLALRTGPYPPFRRQLEAKGVSQELISFLELCTMMDHKERMPNSETALAILGKIERGVRRKNWRHSLKPTRYERRSAHHVLH